MTQQIYLKDHEDPKFIDPTDALVGDEVFFDLVCSCEHETVIVSEYDDIKEHRPTNFEQLRRLMRVHPQIQEGHFAVVDMLESKPSLYIGWSY